MSEDDVLFDTGYPNSKMTPERAQKILGEDGLHVSLEQATEILKFLDRLSDIAMHVYFDTPIKPLSSSTDSNRRK